MSLVLLITIIRFSCPEMKIFFILKNCGSPENPLNAKTHKWQSHKQHCSLMGLSHYTVLKEINFPWHNMKCSGENVIQRGIFHVVSCFPLHFMLYHGHFNYFSDSVGFVTFGVLALLGLSLIGFVTYWVCHLLGLSHYCVSCFLGLSHYSVWPSIIK